MPLVLRGCSAVLALCMLMAVAAAGQDNSKSPVTGPPGEPAPGPNKPSPNNPVLGVDAETQAFVMQASIGNEAEIELAQIAQFKSSNPDVKQFAQRLISDHTKNEQQLETLAQQQHIALPTELDPTYQSQKSALEADDTGKFDSDYLRLMVANHTKAVEKFQRTAAHCGDAAVKQYAQQSLPVLQSHLAQATQVLSEVTKE